MRWWWWWPTVAGRMRIQPHHTTLLTLFLIGGSCRHKSSRCVCLCVPRVPLSTNGPLSSDFSSSSSSSSNTVTKLPCLAALLPCPPPPPPLLGTGKDKTNGIRFFLSFLSFSIFLLFSCCLRLLSQVSKQDSSSSTRVLSSKSIQSLSLLHSTRTSPYSKIKAKGVEREGDPRGGGLQSNQWGNFYSFRSSDRCWMNRRNKI